MSCKYSCQAIAKWIATDSQIKRTLRKYYYPFDTQKKLVITLNDLKSDLDRMQVYAPAEVDNFVRLYLERAGCEQLDPILDACVAVYNYSLDEDQQTTLDKLATPCHPQLG